MTTVSNVAEWLEQFAPSQLAESWDNVGLLWGDPAAVVQRVMTCLTVTPATAAEAIQDQAALIVSHHPVLFRAVQRIRADRTETGPLWRLARAGIAIASPHTAFDNTPHGINELLCRRVGLLEVSPLRPHRLTTATPAAINPSSDTAPATRRSILRAIASIIIMSTATEAVIVSGRIA